VPTSKISSLRAWFLHCIAVPVVFVLAATPLLVLNTIQFHSPFKTGYTFWISPIWLTKNPPFSLRYIPDNTAILWRELALRPQRITVASHFGTGTHFVVAFFFWSALGSPLSGLTGSFSVLLRLA
jgi:hypothetical protein